MPTGFSGAGACVNETSISVPCGAVGICLGRAIIIGINDRNEDFLAEGSGSTFNRIRADA